MLEVMVRRNGEWESATLVQFLDSGNEVHAVCVNDFGNFFTVRMMDVRAKRSQKGSLIVPITAYPQ